MTPTEYVEQVVGNPPPLTEQQQAAVVAAFTPVVKR